MPENKPIGSAASQAGAGDAASQHETAYSFAEEFVRMGHDGPKILRMFQNPFYVAANDAYRALGHAATAQIIDKCLAGTSRPRVHAEVVDTTAASRSQDGKKAPGRAG